MGVPYVLGPCRPWGCRHYPENNVGNGYALVIQMCEKPAQLPVNRVLL